MRALIVYGEITQSETLIKVESSGARTEFEQQAGLVSPPVAVVHRKPFFAPREMVVLVRLTAVEWNKRRRQWERPHSSLPTNLDHWRDAL